MSTSPDNSQSPSRSPAEWVSFCIALSILAVIIGLVVYSWLTRENKPPIVSVTYEREVRQVEGQFYIPFVVQNIGGGTVESVQVVAQLRINGEIKEVGELPVDFLSSGETQEGAFIFNHNPEKGELVVRVASYKLP